MKSDGDGGREKSDGGRGGLSARADSAEEGCGLGEMPRRRISVMGPCSPSRSTAATTTCCLPASRPYSVLYLPLPFTL